MPRPRPPAAAVAVPTSISLTAAHVAHLARLAAERETTISALVREALDAHHGPPPPLSIPDNPRQPKLFTQWRV